MGQRRGLETRAKGPRRPRPEKGWLARGAVDYDVPARPWLPDVLATKGFDQSSVAALRYFVVDELIDTYAGLCICPWPDADERGRLRFKMNDVQRVGCELDPLVEYLAEARGAGTEKLHIGEVFAAEVADTLPPVLTPPLSQWIKEPLDISAEARKVAKLAFFGAAADVLPRDQAHRWRLDELEER